MKIRIFLNFKEDERISMENYAKDISKGLKKYYKNISISNFRPKVPKYLNIFPKLWKMRLARYFFYKLQIRNLNQVDIAHIVDPQYAHLVENIKAKKKVITVHDLLPIILSKKHNTNRALIKYSLSKLNLFDNVITISNYTKKHLTKFTNVDKKKISIIYQPASEILSSKKYNKKFITKFVKNKKSFIILTFSHVFYKNFKTSYKIFNKLRKKYNNIYLLNFGKLPKFINNNLDKNIVQLPYLNEKQHNDIFKSSNVLLFPSSFEGYGKPCVEAIGAGLPVISSDIPALKEIFGNSGIQCKPYAVDCFVKKITNLIENKKDIKKIKKKYQKRYSIFNRQKYFTNLFEIYSN